MLEPMLATLYKFVLLQTETRRSTFGLVRGTIDHGFSRSGDVDVDSKFAFPVASTVGLEDEVVACCCSQEIEAFFCPRLVSPLSVHWRRKLSVSLLAAVD